MVGGGEVAVHEWHTNTRIERPAGSVGYVVAGGARRWNHLYIRARFVDGLARNPTRWQCQPLCRTGGHKDYPYPQPFRSASRSEYT
jgi:hypothetical protein